MKIMRLLLFLLLWDAFGVIWPACCYLNFCTHLHFYIWSNTSVPVATAVTVMIEIMVEKIAMKIVKLQFD